MTGGAGAGLSDGFMLHRCGPDLVKPAGANPHRRWGGRTVDAHCHLFTPDIEPLVRDLPARRAEIEANAQALGAASGQVNEAMFASIGAKLTDPRERLKDMDALGIDIQVVSPSPTQYYYWAEAALSEKIVRGQNDAIAAYCLEHPSRFVGLGALSLQHLDLAVDQLEELILRRGFKGVQISTLVNGIDLADERYAPFWKAACDLNAVVFIHPWGSTLGDRLSQHYMLNVVGQPLETTICISKLILNGTLDRHPNLKILSAHGGGYLPLGISRSDHAHAVRPDVKGCLHPPSTYLRKLWYDTVVYSADHIKRLIEVVGDDRLVLGTDYPFDMGCYDLDRLLSGLDRRARSRIRGENALSLFGLALSDANDLSG